MKRKGADKGIFLVVSVVVVIFVGFMLLNMAGIKDTNTCTEENQHSCCPSIHDMCDKEDELICDIRSCDTKGCQTSCINTGGVCYLVDKDRNSVNEVQEVADDFSCISRECFTRYRDCSVIECESKAFMYDPEDETQTSWRSIYVDEEGNPYCCSVEKINERVVRSC